MSSRPPTTHDSRDRLDAIVRPSWLPPVPGPEPVVPPLSGDGAPDPLHYRLASGAWGGTGFVVECLAACDGLPGEWGPREVTLLLVRRRGDGLRAPSYDSLDAMLSDPDRKAFRPAACVLTVRYPMMGVHLHVHMDAAWWRSSVVVLTGPRATRAARRVLADRCRMAAIAAVHRREARRITALALVVGIPGGLVGLVAGAKEILGGS